MPPSPLSRENSVGNGSRLSQWSNSTQLQQQQQQRTALGPASSTAKGFSKSGTSLRGILKNDQNVKDDVLSINSNSPVESEKCKIEEEEAKNVT